MAHENTALFHLNRVVVNKVSMSAVQVQQNETVKPPELLAHARTLRVHD